MKKIIAFFILIILITFVSCDTITHYTVRVSVDRNPTLIIENKTGHPVDVTAPVASPRRVGNGAETLFQPTNTRGTINVTYKIGEFEFTQQANMDNADVTVALTRRPPTITVLNNTGHTAAVSTPFSLNMSNEARHIFLTPRLNQNIDITYRIGQMTLTEQVNMREQDVTVNLRSPPTITVVNNVGATINTIFLRAPGAPEWMGGNIIIRGGTVHLAETAQAGELSGSIVSGDRMQIWMGNIPLSGDRFDIRIDDVRGFTYVKSNVQIRGDMNLTFTNADRR